MQSTTPPSYQSALDKYISQSHHTSKDANAYLQRIGDANPYRKTYVRFSSGETAFVTQMGVLKRLKTNPPSDTPVTQLTLPWKTSYSVPGTLIPTVPALISGTDVVSGQTLGLEGTNVFVDRLSREPIETQWEGCFRQFPVVTETLWVPVMPPSNQWNGFTSTASSVYENNNAFAGPWAAFNRSLQNFWHSSTNKEHQYDAKNGDYKGTISTICRLPDNSRAQVPGEFIEIQASKDALLSKYEIQGRQGCCGTTTVNARTPNSWVVVAWVNGEWLEIDTQQNQNLNYDKGVYTLTNTPRALKFRLIVTNCGSPNDLTKNRYCVQISQWNLFAYQSSSSDDASNQTTAMDLLGVGISNADQCRDLATFTGNSYFSLSDTGECRATNDLARAQQFGSGDITTPTSIWDSWSSGGGKQGVQATLGAIGSLQVFNASQHPIYMTPLPDSVKSQLAPPIGCYSISQNTFSNLGENYAYNAAECLHVAKSNDAPFVGYSGDINTDGKIFQCVSASKSPAVAANTCIAPAGGIDAASVYSTSSTYGSCFLILQDDGNMCIYQGTGPEDNQGVIWASGTTGKQLDPDSNHAAAKGKTGRNTLLPGETLFPNEFIGSTRGDIYLVMQSDGNLVLYTSHTVSGCTRPQSTWLGTMTTNAVYRLARQVFPFVLGSLGRVDEDAVYHPYTQTQIQFSNKYNKWTNVDISGNDLPGGAFTVNSVDDCQSRCTDQANCGAFVVNGDGTGCWLKSGDGFPYTGQLNGNTDRAAFIRGREPKAVPPGWTREVTNIDSETRASFVDSGSTVDMTSPLGLAAIYAAVQSESQEVDQIAPDVAKETDKSMQQWQEKWRSQSTMRQNMHNSRSRINSMRNREEVYQKETHETLSESTNDSKMSVHRAQYWFLIWVFIVIFTMTMAWVLMRLVASP